MGVAQYHSSYNEGLQGVMHCTIHFTCGMLSDPHNLIRTFHMSQLFI